MGVMAAGGAAAAAAGGVCLLLYAGSGGGSYNSFKECPDKRLNVVSSATFSKMTIPHPESGKPWPKLPYWCIMWEHNAWTSWSSGASVLGALEYWLFDDWDAAVHAMENEFSSMTGSTRILFTYNPAARMCAKELYTR